MKREWARGAVVNQAVAAGAVFAINLLSGYETDVSADFRGTVMGLMQSWMSITSAAAVNCTVAIGVIPESLIVLPGHLSSAVGLKEYPWVYYRRVLNMGIPAGTDTIQYGALSFDTNTRSARKLRQKNESYQLIIDNLSGTALNFCHWSNILLKS
jgi:hypothetical protein